MARKQQAIAFILSEETFDAISYESGIEKEVLETWFKDSEAFGFGSTYIIVVKVIQTGEEE